VWAGSPAASSRSAAGTWPPPCSAPCACMAPRVPAGAGPRVRACRRQRRLQLESNPFVSGELLLVFRPFCSTKSGYTPTAQGDRGPRQRSGAGHPHGARGRAVAQQVAQCTALSPAGADPRVHGPARVRARRSRSALRTRPGPLDPGVRTHTATGAGRGEARRDSRLGPCVRAHSKRASCVRAWPHGSMPTPLRVATTAPRRGRALRRPTAAGTCLPAR
jgi:hypothetical protein